jgi:hypothetical protein
MGRKYFFNESYFSNMTNESIYWAGFIAADGCLYGKQKSLSIMLSKRDKDHLFKFKDAVKYTGDILDLTKTCTNGARCELVRLTINGCKSYYDDLIRLYNITPKKSLTIRPPDNLTLEQSLIYIRVFRWKRMSLLA